MTLVSNDPSWWQFINSNRICSYVVVSAFAGVMYDWVLTLEQEVELIWRQHWSLMTIIYLSVRYIGILFAIINVLFSVRTISVTDVGCRIMFVAMGWMNIIVLAMLGVVIIARLHAMYQGSRRVLILLVVVFLAVTITNGVIAIIGLRHISAEEIILSSTYECAIQLGGDGVLLDSIAWMVTTVWESLALCVAGWIAVKHFRELRRHSAGGIIRDCFTVLIKTHVVYFVNFIAISCFTISYLSPTLSKDPYSLQSRIYIVFSQVLLLAQMLVLGPRLILSVREYNAKLVADSDTGTAMTSIVFLERVHMSTRTSSSV